MTFANHPLMVVLSCALAIGSACELSAQTPTPPSAITRTELLKQVLPAGNFRNVQTVVVELAPNAVAPPHRHDVAVMAYVLEGEVENRFDAGTSQLMKVGEAWWEAPGTVHNVARNTSTTARARLLIVYIGEDGKALSVPVAK